MAKSATPMEASASARRWESGSEWRLVVWRDLAARHSQPRARSHRGARTRPQAAALRGSSSRRPRRPSRSGAASAPEHAARRGAPAPSRSRVPPSPLPAAWSVRARRSPAGTTSAGRLRNPVPAPRSARISRMRRTSSMLDGSSVSPTVTTSPAWKSAAGVVRNTRCGLTAPLNTANARNTQRMLDPADRRRDESLGRHRPADAQPAEPPRYLRAGDSEEDVAAVVAVHDGHQHRDRRRTRAERAAANGTPQPPSLCAAPARSPEDAEQHDRQGVGVRGGERNAHHQTDPRKPRDRVHAASRRPSSAARSSRRRRGNRAPPRRRAARAAGCRQRPVSRPRVRWRGSAVAVGRRGRRRGGGGCRGRMADEWASSAVPRYRRCRGVAECPPGERGQHLVGGVRGIEAEERAVGLLLGEEEARGRNPGLDVVRDVEALPCSDKSLHDERRRGAFESGAKPQPPSGSCAGLENVMAFATAASSFAAPAASSACTAMRGGIGVARAAEPPAAVFQLRRLERCAGRSGTELPVQARPSIAMDWLKSSAA